VPSANSNATIEYKEFGIRLTLTPTVVSNDRSPQGRPRGQRTGLQQRRDHRRHHGAGPDHSPHRHQHLPGRRREFVISGLISTQKRLASDKFPGLGDIPILGAFFRSSAISREERELLMIVTPHLVQPLAANAQLPSLPGEKLRNYDPNWYRLYFLENGDFDKRSGLSQ
jgi:pilus assembly protein CpaC